MAFTRWSKISDARAGRRRFGALAILALILSCAGPTMAAATEPAASSPAGTSAFGTFLKPFAADSPWNSRPVDPVLGEDVIPPSTYGPSAGEGPWSLSVFLAKPDDLPMTVVGPPGQPAGVFDADAIVVKPITIAHWPADTIGAAEADGHADIVDPQLGVIHSFWQLRKIDGRWTAALYAWAPLAGRGWGDPAHYAQGPRSAGVPAMAGIPRKHEVHDGDTMYRHALMMSMTFNGLSGNPTYVFPATAADSGAETSNTGKFPEGSLLMLPASFDTKSLSTPEVRKIAETLKVYGGYVVERNVGTPFGMAIENGSGFDPGHNGSNTSGAADFEAIRKALRRVVGANGWVDGNGRPFVPNRNLNRLSMRGPWQSESGPPAGQYDTYKQAVVFPASRSRSTQSTDSGNVLRPVLWAPMVAGQRYKVTALTTGDATLRIVIRGADGVRVFFDSGELGNNATKTFIWPAGGKLTVHATSGSGGPSSVGAEVLAVE